MTQPHWQPTGLFPTQCMGESFYADSIAAIATNPPGSAALVFCTACLIPEESNPHDPNAVRVEIAGRLVGHLPREFAQPFLSRLAEVLSCVEATTCDAVISNGLVTPEKTYSYTIELDVHLDQSPSRSLATTYPIVQKRDPEPKIAQSADGSVIATVWLGPDALGNLHKKLRTMSWTTEEWSTVNYYVKNAKGIGLGHRLLSIPKTVHRQMFGSAAPIVTVESISGRTALVRLVVVHG